MTYTTEQLQGMSDHTVNHALYAKMYYSGQAASQIMPAICPDYCNNPNDVMPLAFELGIGIEKSPLRMEWIARTCEVNMSNKQFRCCIDINPLRAIACCLLMM